MLRSTSALPRRYRPFGFAVATLLALGLLPAAHAQQAPPVTLPLEDQQRGLNGMQKNFYFALTDTPTEADYRSAGFFGQKLRPYLVGNPDALAALNRYRRQKSLFLAERLVFVGAVGLYGQQVFSDDNRQQYFNSTQQIAIGVAAFSLLSNIFVSRNTNTHFQQAVRAYNAGRTSFRPHRLHQLLPGTVGLAASPQGQPLLALRWSL